MQEATTVFGRIYTSKAVKGYVLKLGIYWYLKGQCVNVK